MAFEQQFTEAQLKAALWEAGGIYSKAAEYLGTTRQAVWFRVKNSPVLIDWMREIEEAILDTAEGGIHGAIKCGDMQTTRWFLERKGKVRGFANRQELTGKDGEPLNLAPVVNITISYVEPGKLEEDPL